MKVLQLRPESVFKFDVKTCAHKMTLERALPAIGFLQRTRFLLQTPLLHK